jgi:hypothetical protein
MKKMNHLYVQSGAGGTKPHRATLNLKRQRTGKRFYSTMQELGSGAF